jgi:hypothetical protein
MVKEISCVQRSEPERRLEIAAIAIDRQTMDGWGFVGVRSWTAGAAVLLLLPAVFLACRPIGANAQTRNLLPPELMSPVPTTPGTGATLSPDSTLVPPPPPQPPSPPQPVPMIAPGQVALAVTARYGRDAPAINGGVVWRVYTARPDAAGAFRLVKEDRTVSPTFVLPPGSYVVHASLGLASATKAVQLRTETVREVFEIPAGAIRLEGRVGDVRIPGGQIWFDIFSGSQFNTAERRPVAHNVMTGDVVLLPEGTYYIVSNYGDGNSVVRSDVRVQTAKLTDVVVNHRAALITLKLVNDAQGEALANTQWTVLTPGGDVIKESIGAFPRVVLAEGDYHVIARNEGKTFQRDFKVIPGVDGEVEVLAR